MRIDSSTVGMRTVANYRSRTLTYGRFSLRDYRESLAGKGGNSDAAAEEAGAENKANAKSEGQYAATLQDWQSRLRANSNVAVRNPANQTLATIRHATISYIFDLLFAVRRDRMSQWMPENGAQTGDSRAASSENAGGSADSHGTGLTGAGMFTANMKVFTYSQEVLQFEREDVSFSTAGMVRTADGREISFNVNVGMSREFQQVYRQDLELASFSMCDPLVINLDTDVAEFSDQTFYFDIDVDGEPDEVSRLGPGSGYLALDKNGDGIVNDGSELFGTVSGNGFADLAKYDEDGNGWIDENDAIWEKLKIWCADENGKAVLYRLSDKGVGAICLQNAATDFTVKKSDGQTQGAIRNTGVFLYENGGAGTVQHLDVAKYYAKA